MRSGIKSCVPGCSYITCASGNQRTAHGVDFFVANSAYVARRIRKAYGYPARVVYPPVDVDRFTCGVERSDFYLTASRLVPYKKIRLIVEAFAALPRRKLIVIGDGPDMAKIKAIATENVEILGYQSIMC